jgi:hypothetical protein
VPSSASVFAQGIRRGSGPHPARAPTGPRRLPGLDRQRHNRQGSGKEVHRSDRAVTSMNKRQTRHHQQRRVICVRPRAPQFDRRQRRPSGDRIRPEPGLSARPASRRAASLPSKIDGIDSTHGSKERGSPVLIKLRRFPHSRATRSPSSTCGNRPAR